MYAAFLQKMFFKDVKVAPNPRWEQRAKKLGHLSHFNLERRSGRVLGSLHVAIVEPLSATAEPGVCSSGCQCMANTLVVLAHPINKKAKYFFSDTGRAAVYLNCGATVVMFDFNGFGESDSIDLFYWKDARAVVEFAHKQFPEKQFILHGASFGAFHVIRASQALPSGSTLILENVNKSLISYWKRWPLTYFLASVLEIIRVPAVRDMNVKGFVKSLRRKDLNVKFLACEHDTFTTVEEMQELFDDLTIPAKTFTLFEGASHLTANVKHKLLYERVLKNEECQLC